MSEVEGKERRRREHMGLALIIMGAVLFMLQFVGGPKEAVVFLIIGGAFLVAYVQNRKYGMLVPGCILIGLGIGRVGEWANYDFDDFEHIGLGIGFILIFAIDRLTGGKPVGANQLGVTALLLGVNKIAGDRERRPARSYRTAP